MESFCQDTTSFPQGSAGLPIGNDHFDPRQLSVDRKQEGNRYRAAARRRRSDAAVSTPDFSP